ILPMALALSVGAALLYSRYDPRTYLSAGVLIENAGLRIVWLSLATAILYLLCRTDLPKRREILQLALVLCVGFDAWTHAPNQNPTISPGMYAPNVLARELNIGPVSDAPRAFTSRRTHDVIYGAMIADAEKDFTGRRYNLFGNLNLLEHVPIIDGFYSLYLPEQRELWLNMFFATNFPGALGDFLGISRMSTNVFDWQPRPSALPLITTGVKPFYEQDKYTISFLMSAAFDPRRVVALPMEAHAILKATNGAQARVSGSSVSSSRIEAQVEASEPALVVFSQSYYHRWHAYVNDKPVKLWRANHAFQALEVPAGSSNIKIIYEDPALGLGAILSSLALLGCVTGWFFLAKRPSLQTTASATAA
ncbi:MAG TPA: YfhO family protein, partial [Candidatus Saccharimonadales bacterium]|nr:YfhO family protein [Candidatus Saccharimonadales bacterium]